MIRQHHRGYIGFVAALLAAILASQPFVAGARERYRLPAGQRLTTAQGTFQGYTLEEFKLLLKMDVDLESFTQQIPKYVEVLENNDKLISNLHKQLELKDKSITILQEERVRLTEKWTEENRLRHVAENKGSWTPWLAWGAAGVATVVAAVLSVVLIAKET